VRHPGYPALHYVQGSRHLHDARLGSRARPGRHYGEGDPAEGDADQDRAGTLPPEAEAEALSRQSIKRTSTPHEIVDVTVGLTSSGTPSLPGQSSPRQRVNVTCGRRPAG
jgi:hypothetical protein